MRDKPEECRAWADRSPTPLQELAAAFATEAVRASGKIDREHAALERAMDRLREAGADRELLLQIDQAAWSIHTLVCDLAALVGLETGRRCHPAEWYETIISDVYLRADYEIPSPAGKGASGA